MFERYTERARRVLFFARYEASEVGTGSIEPEHLLLGLIRQNKGVASRILQQAQVSLEQLRSDVTGRMSTAVEKLPTSVEIPFSGPAKRTLQYAAEEADRLTHSYIGVEHLLLALLRDEATVAGAALAAQGLRLGAARDMLVSLLDATTHVSLTRNDVAAQVDAIKKLVMQL
jgi:ATP-dependent Clp protease ATP-binding subunit ClpC